MWERESFFLHMLIDDYFYWFWVSHNSSNCRNVLLLISLCHKSLDNKHHYHALRFSTAVITWVVEYGKMVKVFHCLKHSLEPCSSWLVFHGITSNNKRKIRCQLMLCQLNLSWRRVVLGLYNVCKKFLLSCQNSRKSQILLLKTTNFWLLLKNNLFTVN